MDKKTLKERTRRLEKLILDGQRLTWKDRASNFWDNLNDKLGLAVGAGISAAVLALSSYGFYTTFSEEDAKYNKFSSILNQDPNLLSYLRAATNKGTEGEYTNNESFLDHFSPLEKEAWELCTAFPSDENKGLCDVVDEISFSYLLETRALLISMPKRWKGG